MHSHLIELKCVCALFCCVSFTLVCFVLLKKITEEKEQQQAKVMKMRQKKINRNHIVNNIITYCLITNNLHIERRCARKGQEWIKRLTEKKKMSLELYWRILVILHYWNCANAIIVASVCAFCMCQCVHSVHWTLQNAKHTHRHTCNAFRYPRPLHIYSKVHTFVTTEAAFSTHIYFDLWQSFSMTSFVIECRSSSNNTVMWTLNKLSAHSSRHCCSSIPFWVAISRFESELVSLQKAHKLWIFESAIAQTLWASWRFLNESNQLWFAHNYFLFLW